MPLDRLSLSTVPIIPFFNDRELAGATGFIWNLPRWLLMRVLAKFAEPVRSIMPSIA